MRMFRRVPKLPADRRPALRPGERVVAWADVDGEAGTVVVTNGGLWLPGRPSRLGFHAVHKAAWTGRSLEITPARIVEERETYTVVADLPAETFVLPEPDDVPDQVRARVTRSVGYTSHHRLAGGGGLRVVARRVSGVDGVTWTVRYDPGTDGSSPEVVDATAELVAQARAAAA
jgi:hypothetical protein